MENTYLRQVESLGIEEISDHLAETYCGGKKVKIKIKIVIKGLTGETEPTEDLSSSLL